jgi:hypothetical protein
MLRRWHVVLLLIITLVAFCLLAAAKLRATPKYDRVQPGMSETEIVAILGQSDGGWNNSEYTTWTCDEGQITIRFKWQPHRGSEQSPLEAIALEKTIMRRGPLDRLLWLLGRRSATPTPILSLPLPTQPAGKPTPEAGDVR